MLRELQLAMLGVVTGGAGDAGLERLVAGDERLSAAGRLRIYAEMVRERLRAALAATFPALAAALGDEAFAALAVRYLAACPSRHPSLRWVGRALPAYLEGWEADLAALEWARHDVFDAPDEPLLDLEAARRLGPDGVGELPLRLVAAHRRVGVRNAVEAVWREVLAGGRAPVAETAPGVLLVWRHGVAVFHRRVGVAEEAALVAAAGGASFAALCERLCEVVADEDVPRVAGELLRRWLSEGLLGTGR
jgi:hypothetical protein